MPEVEGLLEEGQALQGRLGQLGETLCRLAEDLKQGHPPPAEVLAQLTEASASFEDWLGRARRVLGVGVEPILPQVLEALKAHRQQLKEVFLRQKALQVLEQVSSLVYRGAEEFMPLSAVQFDALGLMRQLKESTTLGEGARALAEGRHPYNLLLQLVANKELSDEEWVEAYQRVGQELGQELAVAAARGRLSLPD
ncbi:hypothetical protein [Meiothermus sp. QL-1]|uniref:hypothetical protein n=1 Tax=Meiothermus sp. QL-1 TaxID=2058095 RepID=UPI0011C06109|nr:hypothetical protein [Meiothermus sp. QL-1]